MSGISFLWRWAWFKWSWAVEKRDIGFRSPHHPSEHQGSGSPVLKFSAHASYCIWVLSGAWGGACQHDVEREIKAWLQADLLCPMD